MLSSAQPTCFLIADISGLHRVPRRRRARPRPGHPRRPHRRRRHRPPAELPAGQARGRRRVHLRDGRDDRRLDAARHHRALLLRVPPAPARRPPGDVVRVQRLRPHPRPRPQVRRPPRRRPSARRSPGARSCSGRTSSSSIGCSRTTSSRSWASRPTPCISQACIDASGPRPGGARHARSTPRRTTGSARSASGSTTSSAAGRRRRRAAASSSSPDDAILIVSVPTSVPPQVAWEFLTTPGQRMSWQPWVTEVDGQGRDRRPARARLGQPLHARQGRGHRGDPRLAAVRLRHRPDDPRHAERPDEAAPHHRVRAGHRRARRSTSATPRRRPSARRSSWR